MVNMKNKDVVLLQTRQLKKTNQKNTTKNIISQRTAFKMSKSHTLGSFIK